LYATFDTDCQGTYIKPIRPGETSLSEDLSKIKMLFSKATSLLWLSSLAIAAPVETTPKDVSNPPTIERKHL